MPSLSAGNTSTSSSTGTSKYGNALYAPGKAQPKKPADYKIVGQPINREDIAPKVFAQEDFVTDVKLPGMMHGAHDPAAGAGAIPVKIDDSAIKNIPGPRGLGGGFPRRRRRQGMGCDPGVPEAQGGMVAGQAAIPPAGLAA